MKKFLLLMFCLVLFECAIVQSFVGVAYAAKSPDKPIKNSEVFSQSFDKVWDVVLMTVSEKGFPIVTASKDSGLISTQPIPLEGAFNVPARIERVAVFNYHVVPFNDARYAVNILISKQDSGTMVVVTPKIEGFNREIWVAFKSNGTIEDEIIQAIKSKLKAGI